MSRARRALVASLVISAAPLGAAVAQTPHTLSLRLDNDAFDFWMMPYNRPDEEYTSGVHVMYDVGRAPWWSRSFLDRGAACTYHVQECHAARAELGQDIFTPSASVNDPRPAAGSRANGGWLYYSESARSLNATRSTEVTLALGVTGPPSLARFTQNLAHNVAPAFNRPTDWSRQIRFEPGAILGYERRDRVARVERGAFSADVIPRLAARVGNVETSGAAGVESRVGWNLPHPWLPERVPASVSLVAGVEGRAVVRDIFLDGNTFDPVYRVGHRPFIESGELGVEMRYRAFSLTYRAVSQSRSYADGPKWHPWASIVSSVTFDR